MKRFILLTMVLLLLLPMSAMAAETQVEAVTGGDRNVLFSNGYLGFCLDNLADPATPGAFFTVADNTSAAISNRTDADISQKLKILFTQCFEDIFVSNGSGGYQIADTNVVQHVVWWYSDNYYISPTGQFTSPPSSDSVQPSGHSTLQLKGIAPFILSICSAFCGFSV